MKVVFYYSEFIRRRWLPFILISGFQKLREELRTLNGEEAEYADDSDDDAQKTFKNMLASKYWQSTWW